MRGQYKGSRLKGLRNMNPNEQYMLLRQAYDDNFGGVLKQDKNNKLIYVPKNQAGKYYGHDLGSAKLGN
jgi:hypothetical protein